VLPGGVDSVTTSTTATANVERYKARGDGPFIVCGVDTMLGGGGKGKGNGTLSVLLNNTAQLNPEAIGETFKIHGPQIADCDMKSSSFKGLADQEANAGLPVGTWWDGDTGVKAGPTRVEVNGIQGCAQATTAPNDCIMLLPVAANPPKAEKQGSTPKFFIVRLAAFMVTRVSANEHYGTLLDDYMVSGPSEPGWCRDCGGVVVVRLTE
jgi:hypothetical protein